MNTPTPEETKRLLERLTEVYESRPGSAERSHSVSCPYPEGCSCETVAYNRMARYIAEINATLPSVLSLASQSHTATQRADALAEEVNILSRTITGLKEGPLKVKLDASREVVAQGERRIQSLQTQLTAAQEREHIWRDAMNSALHTPRGEALSDNSRLCLEQCLISPPSDAGKAGWPSDEKMISVFDVLAAEDPAPTPSTEGKGGSPCHNCAGEGHFSEGGRYTTCGHCNGTKVEPTTPSQP